jgi:endonuclease
LHPSRRAALRGIALRGLGDIQPSPEVEDGPGADEVEDAVVTTFGLERDLQRSLRETIAQLEPDLKLIDEGREHRSAAGQIDLLCDGGDGALMVVELEAGVAKDAALGQDQA